MRRPASRAQVPQLRELLLERGQQLARQAARIRVDVGTDASDAVFVPAVVSWISDEAEFSPKNVQTRESRNELVFRVRVRAPNPDRMLKRGLPVEVWKDAGR